MTKLEQLSFVHRLICELFNLFLAALDRLPNRSRVCVVFSQVAPIRCPLSDLTLLNLAYQEGDVSFNNITVELEWIDELNPFDQVIMVLQVKVQIVQGDLINQVITQATDKSIKQVQLIGRHILDSQI